jgi:hypothetical protein
MLRNQLVSLPRNLVVNYSGISTYIAKPYFDSFLKEAGKDHYQVLKGWLSKLAIFARKKIQVRTITASESEVKVDPGYQQAQTISFIIELNENRRLKILFDQNLTDEAWLKSIEKMIQLVSAHYQGFPSDELTNTIKNLKGRILYGVIDRETTHWIILDDHGMFLRQNANNE